MSARLVSSIVVNALVRRVNAEGGSAMVLAKGDADAGAILVLTLNRGSDPRFFERGYGPNGQVELVPCGPDQPSELEASDYWRRRRERDRDLWVIELDIAEAQRFAAETIT